jgi:hypothetical protein
MYRNVGYRLKTPIILCQKTQAIVLLVLYKEKLSKSHLAINTSKIKTHSKKCFGLHQMVVFIKEVSVQHLPMTLKNIQNKYPGLVPTSVKVEKTSGFL